MRREGNRQSEDSRGHGCSGNIYSVLLTLLGPRFFRYRKNRKIFMKLVGRYSIYTNATIKMFYQNISCEGARPEKEPLYLAFL